MTKRYTTGYLHHAHTTQTHIIISFQKSLPVSILKSQGNVSLKNTEDAISCAFLFFTNRIVNKIERLSTIYYLKIEKSAEIMDAYDFCGLRYAKTDPKQWQEKFKLPRFVYFSLRLE